MALITTATDVAPDTAVVAAGEEEAAALDPDLRH